MLLVSACASSAPKAQQAGASTAPAPIVHPLANMAAQRVIVPPLYAIDQNDALGWAAAIPRSREAMSQIDSAITAEFSARGLGGVWYFTPELEKNYRVNSTYAADPHRLAENPLRGKLEIGKNYGEPLATQLRTMIALQDGGRFVMLPVDVRFEKTDGGMGQAVLKIVLVDARTTEFLWIGEVKSDPASAFGPPVITSLANHFADLVAAR
jgi:hypothetical protein